MARYKGDDGERSKKLVNKAFCEVQNVDTHAQKLTIIQAIHKNIDHKYFLNNLCYTMSITLNQGFKRDISSQVWEPRIWWQHNLLVINKDMLLGRYRIWNFVNVHSPFIGHVVEEIVCSYCIWTFLFIAVSW